MATEVSDTTADGANTSALMSKTSAWADKYRGATVEDIDPPPALSLRPGDSISHALLTAFERDYTHLTVVSASNRALLGYLKIPTLKALVQEDKLHETDAVEKAMLRFRRKGKVYKVITMETPLEELEAFFNGGVDGSGPQDFAVVTDARPRVTAAIAPHRIAPLLAMRSVRLQSRLVLHFTIKPQEVAAVSRTGRWASSKANEAPRAGTNTDGASAAKSNPRFYFEAGYALFAKRPSRPFPPPFLSPPSGSFSDPLSTHDRSRDRRPYVDGEAIRGVTNGDDAVLVSDHFIGANDGVGAWAARERGHAALWSRLILHFWALEAEKDDYGGSGEPDTIGYLQRAYDRTKEATSSPNEWHGTTTASGALLSARPRDAPLSSPVLYVTQLGDSAVLVLRPQEREVVFKTAEQWHWFDCPRQLGTNSPDTPSANAVKSRVDLQEGDVVLAMSDGVIDNLWDHEVVSSVVDSLQRWRAGGAERRGYGADDGSEMMRYVAQEIVKAATVIAKDPFAESPYMEKAVEEGLSIEGGKLDDISVVAAMCKRRAG